MSNTYAPGIHGWVLDESRMYTFYGATAMVKYAALTGGPSWVGAVSVPGTDLKSDLELYEGDRIVNAVQESCTELVLAGLALGVIRLEVVGK